MGKEEGGREEERERAREREPKKKEKWNMDVATCSVLQ